MAKFTGPLIVEDDNNGLWTVMEDFTFFPDGYEPVPVKKDFVTDFYSIPWAFRWLISKSENSGNQAAVCHDQEYQHRKDPAFTGLKRSRLECDNILLQGMTVLGVPWWKRQLIYRAVRLGGWAY